MFVCIIILFRELTELLRLSCQCAYADYELTLEPHHQRILDRIERLGRERADNSIVKCEERLSVSVSLFIAH